MKSYSYDSKAMEVIESLINKADVSGYGEYECEEIAFRLFYTSVLDLRKMKKPLKFTLLCCIILLIV